MTFSAKPRYLPEDLKDFSAPRSRTGLMWAGVAAMLALVAYVQPVEPAIAEEVEPAVDKSLHTKVVVACMNGGSIFWIDPHTGNTMQAACDVHTVSRKM